MDKVAQPVNKALSELKERVSIDLDDGVKVNYGELGKALSPIKGL